MPRINFNEREEGGGKVTCLKNFLHRAQLNIIVIGLIRQEGSGSLKKKKEGKSLAMGILEGN